MCTNNNYCEYCLNGYELSKEKKCIFTQKYDFNISIYNKYRNQLNKIYLSRDKNIRIDLTKYSNFFECDKNCDICYNNKAICIKCKRDFSLIKNKCEKNKRTLTSCWEAHCKVCFSVQSCDVCNAGYTRNKGKCEKITGCLILYCKKCNSNFDKCIECESGYKLVNGQCHDEVCENRIEYCFECYNGTCLRCQDPYKYNDESKKCEDPSIKTFVIIVVSAGVLVVILIILCCCFKGKCADY